MGDGIVKAPHEFLPLGGIGADQQNGELVTTDPPEVVLFAQGGLQR